MQRIRQRHALLTLAFWSLAGALALCQSSIMKSPFGSSSRSTGTSSRSIGTSSRSTGTSSRSTGTSDETPGSTPSSNSKDDQTTDDSSDSKTSRKSRSRRTSSEKKTPRSRSSKSSEDSSKPAKRSSSTESSAEGSKPRLSDAFTATADSSFGIAASAETVALHFTPLDLSIEPGKEFEVVVHMSNRTNDNVDGFQFTIGYDPPWMQFLSYDASNLGASASQIVFDRNVEKGMLNFSAELAAPLIGDSLDLLTLRFRTNEVVGRTRLRFLKPPKAPRIAAVFSQGSNILGRADRGFSGVLDANVFLAGAVDEEEEKRKEEEKETEIDLATALPDEMPKVELIEALTMTSRPPAKPDARVWIALQGPETGTVEVGQSFWVDLVLHNDEMAPLESIGVTVRFDPKVLTVIDEDKDNWIRRGVNIWDGAFHESFPMDYFRANEADNARGVITYQVARYAGAWPFPTNVFARIHFGAKAPSDGAVVFIERNPLRVRHETYVRGMGVDRLDKTWETAAPPSVAIRVVAAPEPLASAQAAPSAGPAPIQPGS